MSQQIYIEYAQKYATTIELLLQQKGSRLRNAVRMEMIRGAAAATPIEQIGPTVAQRRTTRYPPQQPTDTNHQRPWVYPVDYDWSDLIDSIDRLRLIADPESAYAMNGMHAMSRAIDDEIIASFFATRNVGQTGSSTTAFPAGQQVAVDFGAASAQGLTVKKLRKARQLLLSAEVDLSQDEIYVAANGIQLDNLLEEIQVVSTDFNNNGGAPVLKDGRIERFLGMTFIHTERLPVDGSGYRRNPVWTKNGVCLAMWNDIQTDVRQRADLKGLPIQIYLQGTWGATRLEEKRVVEIKNSEA